MADQGGVEVLRVALDPTGVEAGVRRAQRALVGFEDSAKRAADANAGVERGMQQVGQSGQRVSETLDRVAGRNQAAARAIQEHERAISRLESQYREQQRILGQAGGEAATAMLDRMEAEFASAALGIREAQLRGLLSPEEAAERGRQVAEGFRAGMVDVLDGLGANDFDLRARAVGNLERVAETLDDIEPGSARARVGLGRLNDSMVTLTRQALGLHPALGQVLDVAGTFALGTGVMVGILGGLAALGTAWERLTADTREAREEFEEAIDRLRELDRRRALGPDGQTGADISTVREQALEELLSAARVAGAAGEYARPAALAALTRAQARYLELVTLTNTAETDLREEREEAAERQRQRNEDLVRQGQQLVTLAGLEEDTRARVAIRFDAENKAIAARRDLTGEVLDETLAAIAAEERLRLVAFERERALQREIDLWRAATEALREYSLAMTGIPAPGGDGLRLTPVTPYGRSGLGDMIGRALEDEEAAAAVGNLGDAIGSLSERAARGVRGLDALASSVDALAAGPGSGLSSLLNFAAGGIGAISAVSQLLGGLDLFGNEAEVRLNRALDQNTAALDRLRARLEDEQTFDDYQRALEVLDEVQRLRGLGTLSGRQAAQELLTENADWLDALARRVGITPASDPEVIQQFEDAILETILSVEKFGETLAGQRTLIEARNKIYDVTDPAELLRSEFDLLLGRADNLFGDLRYLDFESAAARSVLEGRTRDLIDRALIGDLSADDLRGFSSVDQFIESLLRIDRALDSFTEGLEKASGAVTDIPKAVNLALYRRQFGTGLPEPGESSPYAPGGSDFLPGGVVRGPTDIGAGGRVPGNVTLNFAAGSIVTQARSGEELLRELERAAERHFSHGGVLHLPGVNVAP